MGLLFAVINNMVVQAHIASTVILTTLASIVFNVASAAGTASLYAIRVVVLILAWPLRTLCGILFVLFSPIIYTVAYLLIPVFFFYNLIISLQPLYIYLGSAAFVGITAGLLLKLASTATLTGLGLLITQRSHFVAEEDADHRQRRPRPMLDRADSTFTDACETLVGGGTTTPGISGDDKKRKPLNGKLDDAVPEDWLWLETVQAVNPSALAAVGKRKKKASGLLSQTILEEESEGTA